MKCAVIVAAYRTSEAWLTECVDAIRAQEPLDGWEYELRIGVDGCDDTAAALDRMGQAYQYSEENVGPYLIRNALIQGSPAEAYAIFDADDVMDPSYLRSLIPKAMPGAIAGAARREMDAGGKVVRSRQSYINGICLLSHVAWQKVGGYRPWRIAADHDLVQRAQAMRITIHRHTEPSYSRRAHAGSLTHHPETGFRSRARKNMKRESQRRILRARMSKESLRVEPTCATFAGAATR